MSSPLNIWDEKEQKYVPLPCLKGEDGKDGYTPQKGVDYFTDEDIASLNIPSVDQTYTPESENAQSGKAVAEAINSKQDTLISGTNIKTINGNSILGNGNISIEGGSSSSIIVDQTYSPNSENAQSGKAVAEAVASKANITYVDSSINELNSRFPSIKTVMDEVAVASTQYYLGEVTELNITLPEDAEIGQEITVAWYNGGIASTLAIDGNMLDFDYIPEANTRSEINALWDGTYWSLIGVGQEVPSEVTV